MLEEVYGTGKINQRRTEEGQGKETTVLTRNLSAQVPKKVQELAQEVLQESF